MWLVWLASLFVVAGCAVALYLKSYRAPQLFGEAVFRVKTSEKVVALTFDDGPCPPFTTDILNILKQYDVKATFFVLGEFAVQHPEVIKAIYQDGHEVGNHSWSHHALVFRSRSFIQSQMERTDNLLRSLGYGGTIHFRAPYGRKLLMLPWLLRKAHRPHILFDVIPYDWEQPGTEEIVERVLREVKPGSIILLHDGRGERSQTVRATPGIIKGLQAKGYRFLTISQLQQLGAWL